jgi:hypothetical protein
MHFVQMCTTLLKCKAVLTTRRYSTITWHQCLLWLADIESDIFLPPRQSVLLSLRSIRFWRVSGFIPPLQPYVFHRGNSRFSVASNNRLESDGCVVMDRVITLLTWYTVNRENLCITTYISLLIFLPNYDVFVRGSKTYRPKSSFL